MTTNDKAFFLLGAILIMLSLLCLSILVGCGGQAESSAELADESSYAVESSTAGWCCGESCGLSGAEADVFVGTCLCSGVVRPDGESLTGSCIEYEWPEH